MRGRKWRVVAAAVALLLVTQVVLPVGGVFGPRAAYAATADDGGSSVSAPGWFGILVWLTTACLTSYDSGSWFDRAVCSRAVRFTRWMINKLGDDMCLSQFYDVLVDNNADTRRALHICLLRAGLPALKAVDGS